MHGSRVLHALVVWIAIPSFSVFSGQEKGSSSPSDMVLIPGGEFTMGAVDDLDDNTGHQVYLDSFHIDRHEVTNGQYFEFCRTTNRNLPFFWGMKELHSGPEFPDHPVVGVSWLDAKAYAEWCGKRLPTEAEWEYAARGGLVGKLFPSGDELSPTSANFARSERGGTVPVASFPENGYGLYDMAGNVAEWVEDFYGPGYYQKSPYRNPKGPEKGKFRIFRGGGFHSGAYCNRVTHRNALPENWLDFNVGFRCAKDATTP